MGYSLKNSTVNQIQMCPGIIFTWTARLGTWVLCSLKRKNPDEIFSLGNNYLSREELLRVKLLIQVVCAKGFLLGLEIGPFTVICCQVCTVFFNARFPHTNLEFHWLKANIMNWYGTPIKARHLTDKKKFHVCHTHAQFYTDYEILLA